MIFLSEPPRRSSDVPERLNFRAKTEILHFERFVVEIRQLMNSQITGTEDILLPLEQVAKGQHPCSISRPTSKTMNPPYSLQKFGDIHNSTIWPVLAPVKWLFPLDFR